MIDRSSFLTRSLPVLTSLALAYSCSGKLDESGSKRPSTGTHGSGGDTGTSNTGGAGAVSTGGSGGVGAGSGGKGGTGANGGAAGASGSGGTSGGADGGSGKAGSSAGGSAGTSGAAGSSGGAADASTDAVGGLCTLPPTCPEGGTIKGTVYAPNGLDPLFFNANIYMVGPGSNDFPEEPQCCETFSGAAACATALSASDGTFVLKHVPLGMHEIDIQIGRFRRRLRNFNVTCGETQLTPDQSRLPKNATEGDLPKIAVSAGEWDELECLLRKVGLDASAVDMFNNSGPMQANRPTFLSLLSDYNQLKKYHIVFLNCGSTIPPADTTVTTNLERYIGAGGRLYVTDEAYDHIEQVPQWAPYACWHSEAETGGTCGMTPEAQTAADIGLLYTNVPMTVKDMKMKTWLTAMKATNADGTINVSQELSQWAMLKSTTSPPVKELVEGPAKSVSGATSGTFPQTFIFDYKSCGRVFYSTYHTIGHTMDLPGTTFPSYCNSDPFRPQERVLEYMMFSILQCDL